MSADTALLVQMETLQSSSSSSIPDTMEAVQLPEPVTQHKMKRKKKEHAGIIPENSILMQTDTMMSSSSSSIPENMELASVLDPITLHKLKIGKKMGKKSVSYHCSVPIDKSPMGHDFAMKISRSLPEDPPSETDTTSCFDSDGTYMRSEGQSSDSGAVLLKKSRRDRGKSRERELREAGVLKGGKKKIARKAKHIIRNSSDFFERYDNKYWAWGRTACFWATTLSIVGSIVGAGVLILMMPRTCDPQVHWWQGKLTLDVVPRNGSASPPVIDIAELIENIPRYKKMGVQTLKLKHIYLKTPDNELDPGNTSSWLPLGSELAASRISSPSLVASLAEELHGEGMTLMVEIPAMQDTATGKMDYLLERAIMTAVVLWAERGVDGISIVGLDRFSADPFLPGNVKTWSDKLSQYGTSHNTKILSAPSLLPHNIEAASLGGDEEDSAAFTGIRSFSLLDASLKLSEPTSLIDSVSAAVRWDLAPSQPWINWGVEGHHRQLTNAELAFLMFLPGTVSLEVRQASSEELVERLAAIRAAAVPVFMNGNYKSCHSHCTSYREKEVNHAVHLLDDMLLLERHFSRRNRYMVVANLGPGNSSLSAVGSLYSGGELLLDTANLDRAGEYVSFKEAELEGMQAYVIKFPK